MTDLTLWTPAAVDKALFALYQKAQPLYREIARLERALADPRRASWHARETERLTTTRGALAALDAEAAPYEAEYRRRRWHRYFLVTNGTGHVHRERACATCYPTTEYAWLWELAGCDEAAMVAEYGETACTVCFPNAPTLARRLGPARVEREREAKRAERAARHAALAAKRAANAITAVDGSALRHPWGGRVTTVTEARRLYVDAVETVTRAAHIPNKAMVAEAHQTIATFGAALVAKTGMTPDALRAAAEKTVARRWK
jgi:hypothetical protein